MSRNPPILDQAHAVASSPFFSHPSSHPSVLLPNNGGGLGGGVQQAPIIPGSIPIPILPSPTDDDIQQDLAEVIVKEGIDAAARLYVQYQTAKNGANAPTVTELLQRDSAAVAKLGEAYFNCHQDSPNARALRMLAPRAGPSYEFEQNVTTVIGAKGKEVTGRKCKGPGCEFIGRDRKRHTEGEHAKDPCLGLYCPCGCGHVLYGRGRASEMILHIKGDMKKGQALSTYKSAEDRRRR